LFLSMIIYPILRTTVLKPSLPHSSAAVLEAGAAPRRPGDAVAIADGETG
jgi:hypothetical protein